MKAKVKVWYGRVERLNIEGDGWTVNIEPGATKCHIKKPGEETTSARHFDSDGDAFLIRGKGAMVGGDIVSDDERISVYQTRYVAGDHEVKVTVPGLAEECRRYKKGVGTVELPAFIEALTG